MGAIHGDDILAEGEPEKLNRLDEVLKRLVDGKVLDRTGPGAMEQCQYLKKLIVDTQDKGLHPRAVVSADDMRKDQELKDCRGMFFLALRTERKVVNDKEFTLQKKFRLQEITSADQPRGPMGCVVSQKMLHHRRTHVVTVWDCEADDDQRFRSSWTISIATERCAGSVTQGCHRGL